MFSVYLKIVFMFILLFVFSHEYYLFSPSDIKQGLNGTSIKSLLFYFLFLWVTEVYK